MFSIGLGSDQPRYEIREIQIEMDVHRAVGASECSTAEDLAIVIEVEAVYGG
jgi:hypothetical protein